jgi:hypothetical protein
VLKLIYYSGSGCRRPQKSFKLASFSDVFDKAAHI